MTGYNRGGILAPHTVPEAWRTPGTPTRAVTLPEVTADQYTAEDQGPFTENRFGDHHQAAADALDQYRNAPQRIITGATPEAAPMSVYTERAHLVALLAALCPSVLAYSDPTEPEWPVVTIDSPAGQLTWHIAPGDLPLFGHVPVVPADDPRAAWDGHTTAVKYARVRALTAPKE